jgi:hypothetical protein
MIPFQPEHLMRAAIRFAPGLDPAASGAALAEATGGPSASIPT